MWFLLALASAFLPLLTSEVRGQANNGEVVFAVNCGGEAHTDSNGIEYSKDPSREGTASDYGKQLIMGRVSNRDQILYQTERYSTATFGYEIPVESDGWYLLVLKFSEVYFNAPNMKVFDVVLNGDLTVAADLDIYEKVGRGVAHDEVVEFKVKNGKILHEGDESELTKNKMRIEFVKSYRDNPKVNAIVLMKGRLRDWTPLPELAPPPPSPSQNEDQFGQGEEEDEERKNLRNPSGPKTKNPYESEDSTTMLPIFVAIGAFVPLVFCLCKL